MSSLRLCIAKQRERACQAATYIVAVIALSTRKAEAFSSRVWLPTRTSLKLWSQHSNDVSESKRWFQAFPGGIVDHPIDIVDVDNLSFYAPCAHFEQPVQITNCTLTSLDLYAAYFMGGLQMRNCTIQSRVTWEAGGHNTDGPVLFQDCVFQKFLNAEDAWFHGPVILERVQFQNGTNLLCDDDKCPRTYCPVFEVEPIVIGVQGNVSVMT